MGVQDQRAVRKTLIMGVLNLTPDSFYPPSTVMDPVDALTRARDELIITRATEAEAGWVTSGDGDYFLDGLPADLVTEVALVPPPVRRWPGAGARGPHD